MAKRNRPEQENPRNRRSSNNGTEAENGFGREAQEAGAEAAEQARRAGEEFGRTAREAAGEAAQQARRVADQFNVAMQCGTILAGAAQSVSREWLNYCQGAMRRNVQGFSDLARCRTIGELVEAQNERFAQELDEFMESSRRASEQFLSAARDAASRIDETAHV